MQLPLQKSFELLQTKWKSILDPLLKNPMNDISILKGISVIAGNNQIPHKLGRLPQGWFLVNSNVINILNNYKPFDESFLYLTSLATDTISLGVF